MSQFCFISSMLNEKILEEIRQTIFDMHSKGLNMSVLADELGLRRETLSRMLNNKMPMKVDQLCYLIVRLHIKGLL